MKKMTKRIALALSMVLFALAFTACGCCFSKRMRKFFRKNEKSKLQFCNKKAKKKRAFTTG